MQPLQDGYAVRSTDAAGDYEVAFEALTGRPQGTLEDGYVAYITTGKPKGSSKHEQRNHCNSHRYRQFCTYVPARLMPVAVVAGGPVPKGADAVVQIENTEQLESAPSGMRRVRILQVGVQSYDGVKHAVLSAFRLLSEHCAAAFAKKNLDRMRLLSLCGMTSLVCC